MPESLSFRDEPQTSDVGAVRRITESTGFFRPDEVDVAVELVEERLAKGVDSGYYFCFADAKNGPAGYVCFGPTPCTVGTFDLYWIAVATGWQGHGLGRILDDKAADAMRTLGGRRVYVETSGKEQYAPTRRFYERTGYAVAATLPEFYGPGDDKVIFWKTL